MVRFKTRWLLLAVEDQPHAATTPFRDGESSTKAIKAPGVASTLTPQAITRLLRASLLNNFGDVASGSFGGVLTCRYYSTHTGTAIVRCTRDGARLVWAAATLISSATEPSAPSQSASASNVTNLRMRVVHCGGTVKKLQTKAIELDRRIILRLRKRQNQMTISERAATLVPAVPLSPSTALPLATDVDDEDLGEALDAVAEPEPVAVATSTKHEPDLDTETASLLNTSRQAITSIIS